MRLPPILAKRYGENELLVRRLLNLDQEFAGACEDYVAAVDAERHWRTLGGTMGTERADEYADLAAELLGEIDIRVKQARGGFKRSGGRNGN